MIKPYYDHAWITIYHGDFREIVPHLTSVDLMLTDPPYANGTKYGNYEDTLDNLRALIPPLMAIRSKRKVITCGVGNIHLYPQPIWILAWHTPTSTASSPWGFSCWQPVLVYGKDPYLQNRLGRQPDFIKADNKLIIDKKHPCAKPLNFIKKLIKRVSINNSDVIIDPLMGVGTTLLAAKNLNRKAIGIELEEKYCERAALLLSQEEMF